MRKAAIWFGSLFAFSVVLGAMVRLSLAHADSDSIINFVTQVLVVGVPTVGAWWNSRKATDHAQTAATASLTAADASQTAADASQNAADAAHAAESNTNGRLDIKLAAIRSLLEKHEESDKMRDKRIDDVSGLVSRHLEMHATQDSGL